MKFIEKILMPHLEWVQLEVSSLCNASCFYCPHTTHRKQWTGRNITLNEFLQIMPYLKKIKLLYLQGWGEPFCNPDFFKFVEIAKKYGCRTGTTTNGMLIEEAHIEKIIDSSMDIIAFSLTGIKKNDTLRTGTKAGKVFKVIERLNEEKIKKAVSKPEIHIAYMLLKSNFDELEEIPETLTKSGIDHVVISILDLVSDSSLKDECLVPETEEEFNVLKNKALHVINKGRKLNIAVAFNLSHPFKKGKTCSEKPLQSIFINSSGHVSPCVFTGIPSEGFKNLYFGNINEQSLPSIWRSREYREFRKKHLEDDKSLPCNICPKRRVVELA
ncbi:radical SAM protein [Thermodesulfovibrio thiophilus]|uniref:radical SAM protein n=1 Tax=Thermodesulfovibrio thiophilus TaxID=340095 RepID=UPI00042099E0|nr:radical SAM/SPASM domain-containing protein [Thermodesulfovibrio thiophilus]